MTRTKARALGLLSTAAVLALPLFGAVSASAQTQSYEDLKKLCNSDDSTDDQTIFGCNGVIASKPGRRDLATAYNNRGYAYDNRAQYDRAIQDYSEAIRIDPKYALAFNNRGFAYQNKGDYVRAVQDYDQALKIQPNYKKALDNRASALVIRDAQAKGDLPGNYGELRAMCNSNASNDDQTIAGCNGMIVPGKTPQDDLVPAYNNRGYAYNNKSLYDQAIRDYSEAIRLRPDYALAFNNRGLSYQNKGDYARAIEDFDQAIKFRPNYQKAIDNRARAIKVRAEQASGGLPANFGQLKAMCNSDASTDDQTIEGCNGVIAAAANVSAGDMAITYNNRGYAYNRKADYDRAVGDYSEAIRLKPDYALAFNNRGISYQNKSDFNRALEDFEQALRIQPEYQKATDNRAETVKLREAAAVGDIPQNYGQLRALCNSNASSDEQTIQGCSGVISAVRPPQDDLTKAFYNRGIAYNNQSQSDQALQDYDQAINHKPDYVIAYNNRGLIYSRKGDQDRAIMDYDQAIRINPNYALAYNNRGLAYFRKGDYDRAIENYDRAIKLNPDYLRAIENRADAVKRKAQAGR
ncbi:tetratricopeptide repeat protein [Methylocella sp. CPCC 101449]|uniref:tetratricopeptide repeat protein n=1 Tax=Methylocella sp. CPCC 101449 TaxID=2987531 RepID=UPI00289017C8|nr:tetratricopeptide repeat protein [Methylocella sp. CPCC 101449]MDT2020660.1 tetratricopeptide repeat protein [Methylocella sp. CPCC 101449]